MSAAVGARDFNTLHAVRRVSGASDCPINCGVKAWPAAAAVVFVGRVEKYRSAICAGVVTGVFIIEQRTGKRWLGGLVEQDCQLVGG